MKKLLSTISTKVTEIRTRAYCNALAKAYDETDLEKVMKDADELLPDFDKFEITDEMNEEEISEVIRDMTEAMRPGFDEINRRARAGAYVKA